MAVCAICGKVGKMLYNHIPKHNLNAKEYRAQYPDSPLEDISTTQRRSDKAKIRCGTDAGKAAMSKRMKTRWEDPQYREEICVFADIHR
jgi:hypothetical protein